MRIDNFALTMHQACPHKYNKRMREHWDRKGKSAALGFGGAMHAGLAEWYRSGDLGQSLLAIRGEWPHDHPVDDYRTLGKCIEVMTDYASHYPHENFHIVGAPDNPMIEVSFTLETGLYLPCFGSTCAGLDEPSDEDPPCCLNCGDPMEPIEYGGIFDGLTESGPNVYVLEHKTTSQLGKTYFYQFKPNNQISGYCWAAGMLSGRRVGGALINAIGVYKSSATKFERSLTTRNDSEIQDWLNNLRQVCIEIKHHEMRNEWPQRTVSCTMYGRCEFYDVCVMPDAKSRQGVLEQDFVQSKWDYEARE